MINLWLGCLRIFAHLGANVSPKGNYISEEAAVWVWVVRVKSRLFYLGKDGIIKGSLLFCNVFFFYDVVYDDSSHIVIIVEINWEPVCRLGIPIFGSNFLDPHQNQISNSVSDSGYSGRIFFLRILQFESHPIRILIWKIWNSSNLLT